MKPFHMGELLARIRVAIRKSEQSSGGSDLGESFECDYLRIDFVKRMVFIDGKEIHVTPIEYKLLTLLVSNRGKVLTHNYIQSKIWGYGEGGDPNSSGYSWRRCGGRSRRIPPTRGLLLQR